MYDIEEFLMETAIDTASGPELTLHLYNGAIRFANTALEKLEEGHFDDAGLDIAKVGNIIQEFQVTLDRSYAIAEPMNDLYRYMYRRLCQATVDESTSHEIVTEVRDMLREFRDTWQQAMQYASA